MVIKGPGAGRAGDQRTLGGSSALRISACARPRRSSDPAAADDGLWDESDEAFTVTFEGIPPGEHSVRIRAVDSLGNAATELRPVHIGR